MGEKTEAQRTQSGERELKGTHYGDKAPSQSSSGTNSTEMESRRGVNKDTVDLPLLILEKGSCAEGNRRGSESGAERGGLKASISNLGGSGRVR